MDERSDGPLPPEAEHTRDYEGEPQEDSPLALPHAEQASDEAQSVAKGRRYVPL
jgi:hypothetical protein